MPTPAPTAETGDTDISVGVLKFISEDALRYHFVSSDDPNVWHTVDLEEWNCSGGCSCPHFEIRILPLLLSRTIKPHSPRAECKHIRAANRILNTKTKEFLVRARNPKQTRPE